MASLSLAYELGDIFELEVALRSLLGGALTVRRKPGLLPWPDRSTEAEAAFALLRVSARVGYGLTVWRAAAETVRAERRAGGMSVVCRSLYATGLQDCGAGKITACDAPAACALRGRSCRGMCCFYFACSFALAK